MSANHPSHSGGHVRYEREDSGTRSLYGAGLALAVIAIVFVAIAWGYFQYLAKREAARSPAASPLSAQARTQPPEPRLQADPEADLAAMRAAENVQLSKLAWVDQSKGIVQVPIERAMELLVASGVPARPGQTPVWLPHAAGIDPYLVPAPAEARQRREEK